MRKLSFLVGLAAAAVVTPAEAYIGPGLGAGTIAVVLGIIAAVFMAFVAVLWYPIKRLIRGSKSARGPAAAKPEDSAKGGVKSS